MLANETARDESVQRILIDAAIFTGQEKNLPELTSRDIPGERVEVDPETVAHLAGGEPAGRSCRVGAHTVTAQRQQSRKAARARRGSGVQVRISPLTETL
jgi:hypothetical protein